MWNFSGRRSVYGVNSISHSNLGDAHTINRRLLPRLLGFLVTLALVATGSKQQAMAAPAPSATQFYLAALQKTEKLITPAFVTYTAAVLAKGAEFGVSYDKQANHVGIYELIGPHELLKTTYQVFYRGSDGLEFIRIAHDILHHPDAGPSRIPLFDPTWQGAYDLLRYGDVLGIGAAPPQPQHASPKSVATPTPLRGNKLSIIAVVHAMSSAFYRVGDEGAAACANGDPGHMVHLIARRDPQHYPLTDATIDMHNGLFCMMRFSIKYADGPFGVTGYVELHFGMQGEYWVATDMNMIDDVRALGIALHHIAVRVSYHDFAFPATLPATSFTNAVK